MADRVLVQVIRQFDLLQHLAREADIGQIGPHIVDVQLLPAAVGMGADAAIGHHQHILGPAADFMRADPA